MDPIVMDMQGGPTGACPYCSSRTIRRRKSKRLIYDFIDNQYVQLCVKYSILLCSACKKWSTSYNEIPAYWRHTLEFRLKVFALVDSIGYEDTVAGLRKLGIRIGVATIYDWQKRRAEDAKVWSQSPCGDQGVVDPGPSTYCVGGRKKRRRSCVDK